MSCKTKLINNSQFIAEMVYQFTIYSQIFLIHLSFIYYYINMLLITSPEYRLIHYSVYKLGLIVINW